MMTSTDYADTTLVPVQPKARMGCGFSTITGDWWKDATRMWYMGKRKA